MQHVHFGKQHSQSQVFSSENFAIPRTFSSPAADCKPIPQRDKEYYKNKTNCSSRPFPQYRNARNVPLGSLWAFLCATGMRIRGLKEEIHSLLPVEREHKQGMAGV